MVVEAVEKTKLFKVLVAFNILLIIVLFLYSPGKEYSDLYNLIIMIVMLSSGVVGIFLSSYKVIGAFECQTDTFKLTIRDVSKEGQVAKIDRMVISTNSYAGKPVGLSIRAHDGSNNKVVLNVDGQRYSFFVLLESRGQRDFFKSRMEKWAQLNRNVKVRSVII